MNSPGDELATARALHDRGDLTRAEAGYHRVLAAHPEHPEALHLLGVTAHQQGDAQRAAHFITRACVAKPDNATYARNLGLALAACGEDAGAAAAFERSLELAPDDPHTRLQLASLHHRRAEPDTALLHYRQALEQLPDLAELHNQIGVCLLQLDDATAAQTSFSRCLALDPAHGDASENRARALLRTRRFEVAEAALETLLQAEPDRDEAWRLLGYARLHQDRFEEASTAFLKPVRARFAPGTPGGETPADPDTVTRTKLRHDVEQLEALKLKGLIPEQQVNSLLAAHRTALASLPAETPSRFFVDTPRMGNFPAVFNRLHLDWEASREADGALNRDLDHAGLTAELRGKGWTVADDFLTPNALANLRRFCSEPTIWFEKKFRHEVGASLRNGFCCPLLLQIAQELRAAFPDIFGKHLFSGCFAYKYFLEGGTGHVHADRGAVSMNMWITPDSANLDPEHGGLVIWNRRVPPEYFREQPEEIDTISERLVNAPDAKASVIPYRCNRAILFPSDVLHRTDISHFAPGHANRRVSVTFLFGRPGD